MCRALESLRNDRVTLEPRRKIENDENTFSARLSPTILLFFAGHSNDANCRDADAFFSLSAARQATRFFHSFRSARVGLQRQKKPIRASRHNASLIHMLAVNWKIFRNFFSISNCQTESDCKASGYVRAD